MGLAVWCEDEAGPFQTVPYAGNSWQPVAEPARQPHQYLRRGTAKVLTLFHPASGQVRVKGVTRVPNRVLHPWLKAELRAIVDQLPEVEMVLSPEENRAAWAHWQAGLTRPVTLPAELPPLRVLLVLDNLAGHRTPTLLLWCFAHGIMPLSTPLSGSWLNMVESVQRIIVRRALAGQHPETPEELIDWLEAVARGWNQEPTPFEWGGKRAARRDRSRRRRHRVGGSGAWTRRPIRRRVPLLEKWLQS